MKQALVLFLAVSCGAASVWAGPIKPGEAAGSITFTDMHYLPRTLQDFTSAKAMLLYFHTLDDSAGLKALDTMAEAAPPEVVVAAADETDGASIVQVAAKALELDGDYTVLKDYDAAAAGTLGVTQTPAAVVLDAERKLRYRGTLDGAKAAVAALMAGQEIAAPEAPVQGSPIIAETLSVSGPLNYASDVAPIINKNCVGCHREGEATPFALNSYKDVAARAHTIAEVVREERMPPWYASPAHGAFMNARTLTTREKDTIRAWVKGGMEEGGEAPAPPAVPATNGWRIGVPDLVLTESEEDKLSATGYLEYKYISFPYRFEEDTWVQGIDIQPDNLKVVHHTNLAFTIPGSDTSDQENFLTGRVPGNGPVDLTGPVAMLIPKGSVLVLQIHYVTTGKEERNLMRVGLRYAEGAIAKRVHYRRLRPAEIAIPPNTPRHKMESAWTFDRNAVLLALFSHMHVRGRDMSFFAKYPDGSGEMLLQIPNYSFDWQLAYQYVPGAKILPKGTEFRTESHYDNSAFNPYNPDPNRTVPYGDQTYDEMNDAYVFYIDADENLDMTVDGNTGRPVKNDALAKAE